ncbi:MAG: DUF1622 domain-containing protein [Candidatus Mcinerneyibacterium aminivorans]|uniref:DUF1622 domain-containing protein n=1 Tax=Candidatus Mcinerneyibacterium aminivorans TaxID=2703815 RepID=A0A5D0MI75_9BACT|nr:MAG: DUF1622 domain-containing protein [Candidatus Mcinerneyibacterium aminivorans]
MLSVLKYIAEGIAVIGVFIFIIGALITLSRFIKFEISRLKGESMFLMRDRLRYVFGSYLLLGLEFLIVADIIKTLIHISLEDMAILGAIVLIRTVITYFLDREREFFHNNLVEEERKRTL